MLIITTLCLGFILDLCFGDPQFLYHPVRAIGAWIQFLENKLFVHFPKTPNAQRIAGAILLLLVAGGTGLVVWLILTLAYNISFYLGFAVQTIMCYQALATKSLKVESYKVYNQLKKNDLQNARKALSMIVARDTANLNVVDISKATVETVAENTTDGVVAPLFFLVIGGPILGFIYKAVSTLDSMVGYKNDKYRYFGTASAKCDDILAYIPARLSAYIMIIATFVLQILQQSKIIYKKSDNIFDGKNAIKIYKRDRFNHKSPNSAHTEAVMAGALNIRLAGNAQYFGKLVKKQTIGDANQRITKESILYAHSLLYTTACLSLLYFVVIRIAFTI